VSQCLADGKLPYMSPKGRIGRGLIFQRDVYDVAAKFVILNMVAALDRESK